jgi:hypothetical protein
MASDYWDDMILDLASARMALRDSPVHGLPNVEDTLEKVCSRCNAVARPTVRQVNDVRNLIAEIVALTAHGEGLVNGWRAALDSLADVYDMGGAPVSCQFTTQQVSTRG